MAFDARSMKVAIVALIKTPIETADIKKEEGDLVSSFDINS